jgi:predicted HicB family RNase H-like nuclease
MQSAIGCSTQTDRLVLRGFEEQEELMAEAVEPWRQLTTRIPKELRRRLKLHCVTHDTSVMEFVAAALEEKLGRKARSKKGTA